MRITEDNFGVFYRAEGILNKIYDGWNIDDDTFKGTLEEESILTMIEDLCDEIEILRKKKEEENDYPDEERDREKQMGIL